MKDETITIWVPEDSIDAYKVDVFWKRYIDNFVVFPSETEE